MHFAAVWHGSIFIALIFVGSCVVLSLLSFCTCYVVVFSCATVSRTFQYEFKEYESRGFQDFSTLYELEEFGVYDRREDKATFGVIFKRPKWTQLPKPKVRQHFISVTCRPWYLHAQQSCC